MKLRYALYVLLCFYQGRYLCWCTRPGSTWLLITGGRNVALRFHHLVIRGTDLFRLLHEAIQSARYTHYFLHDRPWISPSIKSIFNELNIIIHGIATQSSGNCDVISNRLWRHKKMSVRDGVDVWRSFSLVSYGFVIPRKKWNNASALVANCFCHHSTVTLVFVSLVTS